MPRGGRTRRRPREGHAAIVRSSNGPTFMQQPLFQARVCKLDETIASRPERLLDLPWRLLPLSAENSTVAPPFLWIGGLGGRFALFAPVLVDRRLGA